jgi:hypothetical protein
MFFDWGGAANKRPQENIIFRNSTPENAKSGGLVLCALCVLCVEKFSG